jgi:hypothetical protein
MGKLDAVGLGSDGVGAQFQFVWWRFFFSDFIAFPPALQDWVLAHTGTASIDSLELLASLVASKNSSPRLTNGSCSSWVLLREVLPAGPRIGRVQRSIIGSFMLIKIILPLYLTTPFFVIKFHRASRFCEYTDPKEGGNGQLGGDVSNECCQEAGDYDVTHVCGHYPMSVSQRNLERKCCLSFIVDWRSVHDKDLGGARICDRFVQCDSYCSIRPFQCLCWSSNQNWRWKRKRVSVSAAIPCLQHLINRGECH